MLTMALCECGCGEATNLASITSRKRGWVKGQPLRFINGHNARGVPKSAATRAKVSASKLGHTVSPETRAKISASLSGRRSSRRDANHPDWKGEAARYDTIHAWLRKRKQKTGICNDCGRRVGTNGRGVGTDWANISGEYRRDPDDYRELCRRCHIAFDQARR